MFVLHTSFRWRHGVNLNRGCKITQKYWTLLIRDILKWSKRICTIWRLWWRVCATQHVKALLSVATESTQRTGETLSNSSMSSACLTKLLLRKSVKCKIYSPQSAKWDHRYYGWYGKKTDQWWIGGCCLLVMSGCINGVQEKRCLTHYMCTVMHIDLILF